MKIAGSFACQVAKDGKGKDKMVWLVSHMGLRQSNLTPECCTIAAVSYKGAQESLFSLRSHIYLSFF